MRPPTRRQDGWHWNSPDKEWLEHHYVILEKPIGQIARELGAHRNTVVKWLNIGNIDIVSGRRASGETHGNWKGGVAKPYQRRRARKILQEHEIPRVCDHCGTASNLVIHHKDGDHMNDEFDNLQWLCNSCHIAQHWEYGHRLQEALQKIETYERILRDLGVDPDHV
jgi:hypothetical protein